MRRWGLAVLFAIGCARGRPEPAHPAPAAREPSVRVYTATWCKACHALEKALTEKGIAYAAVDIDANAAAFRAAHDETGSSVLPLTRITSGPVVGWVEGANVDVIAAIGAWKGDGGRGVLFAWYGGAVDYVRIEQGAASATSNRGISARTIESAVRVAAKLRSSVTTVARIEFEGDAHPKDFGLWGFANLPVPWSEDRANDLDRSLLLDFAAHADHGHPEAKIDLVRVKLAPFERVIVSLHESEGPRWRVVHVHVLEHDAQGKALVPLGGEDKLRAHVQLADGAWFDRTRFVEGLTAIRSDYREAGYYEVEDDVDYVRKPSAAGMDVDFVISIVRGPRVVIDRIVVDAEGVDESAVRAKLGLAPGDVLRPSRLEAARKRLIAAGLATRVEISTERTEPGKVKVHFEAYREAVKF
ncbi:MAG: POTRA domain-containing protein [Polyangiales bacterium]